MTWCSVPHYPFSRNRGSAGRCLQRTRAKLLLQQPRAGHLDNSKEPHSTTWPIHLSIPLMSSWPHDTNGTQTTWPDSLPPDHVFSINEIPRVPHDQSTSRCAHHRLHCSKRYCFAHVCFVEQDRNVAATSSCDVKDIHRSWQYDRMAL